MQHRSHVVGFDAFLEHVRFRQNLGDCQQLKCLGAGELVRIVKEEWMERIHEHGVLDSIEDCQRLIYAECVYPDLSNETSLRFEIRLKATRELRALTRRQPYGNTCEFEPLESAVEEVADRRKE